MSKKQLNNFHFLVKKMELSMEEVANRIGMTRQTLYNNFDKKPLDENFLKKCRSKLGIIYVEKDQEFILEEEQNIVKDFEQAEYNNKSNTPLDFGSTYYVPAPALPNFLNSIPNKQMILNELLLIKLPPEYKNINYVFEVDGDSMYSTFSNGDHIGCRYVENKKYIRYGEPYILDIGDGGLIFKRLYKSESNDKILLKSDNVGYQDIEVEKNDISHLFIVTAKISKNVGARLIEHQFMTMNKTIENISNKLFQ